MRRMSGKPPSELTRTKEWCLTILDFMIAECSETSFIRQMRGIVLQEYKQQSRRGLQDCIRETNEWARGLPRAQVSELNQLLRDKFGEDLQTEADRDVKRVNRIMKRGRIRNEDEFRLVQARVEDIYADDDKQEEYATLGRLLVDFEMQQ